MFYNYHTYYYYHYHIVVSQPNARQCSNLLLDMIVGSAETASFRLRSSEHIPGEFQDLETMRCRPGL